MRFAVKVSMVMLNLLLLVGCTTTGFGNRPDVQQFVQRVSEKDGFSSTKLTALFNQVQPRIVFIHNTHYAKEKTVSWPEYRAIFITPKRIRQGAAFWNAHETTLNAAQEKYGVDPSVIVGIIGVETSYGEFLGKYRVMDSLSTLAFEYPRRQQFFQNELEQYLLLTRDLNADPLSLYGSYAGAVGLPQFMPSNYRTLAVSATGDKPDLWHNPDDAILSVAHYFQNKGWRPGLTQDQKIEVTKRYNDSDYYARVVLELGQLTQSQRNA
jgi:membrane-bound lytic murein transglycosylase B